MQPIISIVGKSKSGKTTLLESLIMELKQRTYKIAAIKHAGTDFDLDKAGKDSWKLTKATEGVVVISSPHKLAILRPTDHDLTPQEISHSIIWNYDLILAEGFKQSNIPKIEIHSKEQGDKLLCPLKQLLAVVTDEPLGINIPQFSRNEIKGLADLIENWLAANSKQVDINLTINGTFIPMKIFVKNIIAKAILAMISELKGPEEIKSAHISLRSKS